MIETIQGDMVQSINQLSAYPTNCSGIFEKDMKLGLKYASLEENYKMCCVDHPGSQLLGTCLYTELGPDSEFYAISMFVKEQPEDEIQYEALEKCLTELAEYAKVHNCRIAMPQGEAFGNGDWETINEMIERIFTEVDVQLWRK